MKSNQPNSRAVRKILVSITITSNTVNKYGALPFTKWCPTEWSGETVSISKLGVQLGTHGISLILSKITITDCTPGSVVADFNPSFKRDSAVTETNFAICAVFSLKCGDWICGIVKILHSQKHMLHTLTDNCSSCLT
jgi:hypothetical protein